MSDLKQSASDLTPKQILEELDRYIIGQKDAKRAVAIALRNRWRRQQVPAELRDEIYPKNIIMIGATGVGKTEIARRLAKLSNAPFLKIEASKFTEVGYVGRDVESMIRDLLDIGIGLVRAEAEEKMADSITERVEDALIGILKKKFGDSIPSANEDEFDKDKQTYLIDKDGVAESEKDLSPDEVLRMRFKKGDFDDIWIDVEVKNMPLINPLGNFSSFKGAEEMDKLFEHIISRNKKSKKVRVRDAARLLRRDEADKILDKDQIIQEALARTERSGIIFVDEIDKIATDPKRSHNGNDVSRQGVQRDLLPIIEGSSISTKYGVVKTDHILFIAAGAFHVSKPSDLIPELQGRFPIRVELENLTQEHFKRILSEPTNSLTRQYVELMKTEEIKIDITDEAIETIAEMAFRVNENLENIGARRLHTIMERVFEDLSFDAPEMEPSTIVITADYVKDKLDGILADEDLSRYIL